MASEGAFIRLESPQAKATPDTVGAPPNDPARLASSQAGSSSQGASSLQAQGASFSQAGYPQPQATHACLASPQAKAVDSQPPNELASLASPQAKAEAGYSRQEGTDLYRDVMCGLPDIFYVHERSLTEARARLSNNEKVSEDIALRLCAASYLDDIGDDDIMIPVNMAPVEAEFHNYLEHWSEMVEKLGAKGTCMYIIIARDHFDLQLQVLPVHKQPQPITQREWKAIIHPQHQPSPVVVSDATASVDSGGPHSAVPVPAAKKRRRSP